MAMDDKVRQQLVDALNTGVRATREDLLKNFDMEVTVNRSWEGYCNPRVTAAIDSLSPQEVTHLVFTPVIGTGMVIIQTAVEGDSGAEAFARGDSGRTGVVRLRTALNVFGISLPADRNLKFTVEADELPVGGEMQKVLLLIVKRPKRKRVQTRKQGEEKTPEQKAEEKKLREQKALERKAREDARRKSTEPNAPEPAPVAATTLDPSDSQEENRQPGAMP
jgi:hypothetical protein